MKKTYTDPEMIVITFGTEDLMADTTVSNAGGIIDEEVEAPF